MKNNFKIAFDTYDLPLIKLVEKLWQHFSSKRKLQAKILVFLMIISSISELISFGSIIPFLSVLSIGDTNNENLYIRFISNITGLKNINEILYLFIIIFIIAALFSAFTRTFNLWFNTRLSAGIGADLSRKAYVNTINQSYEFHTNINSSEIIASFTNHISAAVSGIFSIFQLTTSAIISLFLICGILFIELPYSLIAPLILFLLYFMVGKYFRIRLRENSYKISQTTMDLIRHVQESLGSIRDVIIGGHQDIFIKKYKEVDYKQRRLKAQNWFLSGSPRYIFEGIGLIFISSIALINLPSRDNVEIISLLSLIALGSQKLLPTLNQLFGHWSAVKAANSEINILLSMLNLKIPKIQTNKNKFILKKNIRLSGISFSYSNRSENVLEKVNVDINKGDIIGIVGKSGSGKSTLIDLILGLKKPNLGKIFIDDIDINQIDKPYLIESWRKSIAHVPQSIYLMNASFAENIAFGNEIDQIDFARVKIAAKLANICEFIEKTKMGFNSMVGERGVNLSGGQLQRIGLARAFYSEADVLIIDEGTSALDQKTERDILTELKNNSLSKTVFLVTHRLSSLRICNKVIEIENKMTKIYRYKDFQIKRSK